MWLAGWLACWHIHLNKSPLQTHIHLHSIHLFRSPPLFNNPSTLLLQVYPEVSPVLLQRFKEREETVKQDVFQVSNKKRGGKELV